MYAEGDACFQQGNTSSGNRQLIDRLIVHRTLVLYFFTLM
jgi:hypothetical protein